MAKSHDPRTRIANAMPKVVASAQVANRRRAILGWQTSDTNIVLDAPGGLGELYITWRDKGTRDVARRRAIIPLAPFLPVLIERVAEVNYIVDIDWSDPAAVLAVLNNQYGIYPHPIDSHSDVTITAAASGDVLAHNGTAWVDEAPVSTSAGAGDAGKLVRLDAGGQVDETMVNDADIDHTAIANIGTNSHATIDTHIAATAAHGATGAVVGTTNVQTLQSKTLDSTNISTLTAKATPVDADSAVIVDSAAANVFKRTLLSDIKAFLKTYFDTLYAAVANGVTGGNSHDHAGGDGAQIDHGSVAGLTDDDHAQYALLLGRAGGQTIYGGVAANEDLTLEPTSHATKTSAYVLIAPSGGNAGVGVAVPAYLLESNRAGDGSNVVGLSGTGAGTGSTLRAYRNRSNANTDSPLVEFVNDAATDDQDALRVQQDGSGAIMRAFSGVTEVFALLANGIGGFLTGLGVGTATPTYLLESNRAGDNSNVVGMSGTAAGTGNTLRAYRNRSSANTDSPVVEFVNDAATDDQVLLRLQGDGSGDLLNVFDGAVEVFTILDGGSVGLGTDTPTAKLHVLEATLGNPVQTLQSTATNDDPTETVVQARVATTDATETTLATITVPASTTLLIEAKVGARRTGGTAGTAEDGAAYYRIATVKNVAGTATLIALSTLITHEDQSTWNCVVDVTGATARVRVTGALDNSITWHATIRTYPVGS